MKKPLIAHIKSFVLLLTELVTLRFLLRGLLVSSLAFAIPQGAQVITGNATVTSPNNQMLQVNQGSDKVILHWQSFNIGNNEKVVFIQPSSRSAALNRINPLQGVSQIYGQLSANGQLILINAAGIHFGPSAMVNVGSIIASTSDISNENFLAGNYIFNQPSPYGGSISNEGMIIAAQSGLVALIGAGVTNSGFIQANVGNIILASGNKFTFDFYGDQLISFTVDEGITQPGVDQNGNPLKNGVSNTGTLLANGGSILISARDAANVLNNVINMEGVAQANSVAQGPGGVIILSGGEQGSVKVSGKLETTSASSTGGKIKILGKNIQVAPTAELNASGQTGGGEILIGGNLHGQGPEQNAIYTYVAPGATILANSLLMGNGGTVVVWSNEATRFYGNIFAEGGPLGGNGGFVETSSKNFLDVNGGHVSTLAPFGYVGSWLLDPANIYIAINQASATAAGMTGTDTSANTGTGTNPITFASAGPIIDSLLTTANLTTALTSSNVIVTTTNDSGTGLGNIIVVSPITWATANSLTLTAANNISINAAITTGSAGSNLILNAAGTVSQTAAIGGSGGLTQQGTGTVNLTLANTYSGTTTVTAGALTLSGAGTALNSTGFTVNQGGTLTLDNLITNNTNRIAGTLTLNGGEFVFKGTNVAATNASETVGALTLGTGSSIITAVSGTGGSTTLTFPSITHTTGATVLFRGTNLGATAGAGATNIMFTSSTGLGLVGGNTSQVNKPIVPFAIGDTSATGTGFGFVTYNINPLNNTANTTGIRPLDLSTEYTTATGTAGVNLKLDTASVSPNVTRAFNSILFSGGRTYTIGSGGGAKILTVTSGAIFSASGAANTITGRATDTLQLGTVEANLFTVGNLIHSTSLFAGTGGLTKSGAGTFTENASVGISGGLTINAGTLQSGIANAFSTSQPLTVRAAGTFNLNNFNQSITTLTLESGSTHGGTITTGTGTLTLGGNVTVNENGSLTPASISGNLALGATRTFTVNNNASLTTSGIISGTNFGIIKAGTGNLILAGANSYSGATTINAGTLTVGSVGGLGNTTSTTVSGTNAALNISFNGATLSNTNTINLNGTGINNAGALVISGNNVTLNNPLVLQTTSTLGGTGTGVLTLGGAITGTSTNLTINLTSAGISLPTTTLTTAGNLSVTTSGPITQTGILTIPGTSSFTAGANAITLALNNVLTGNISLSNTGANDVSLKTSGAMRLGASSIGRNLLAVASGVITLNGIINAGNNVVLAGTGFINNIGASALAPGGYFQVWSSNPSSDTRGGLAYNYKQYNATYGVTPVQGTGSGFLYTIAPTITPSLVGSVSKTYTGTNAATLAPSNYSYAGNIDSDVITLNNPTNGTYASVNVGSNINVSVSGISIISAHDGSATVYGYQIVPTANANIGQITQAPLTVTANNAVKTYGQTVTFTGTEFSSVGLQNSETIGSVTLNSAGAINTANVPGSPYAIVPSLATGGTFNPLNYSITYTNGALTVNPASLTVTANNAVKTYGQTVTFTGNEFTSVGLQNAETIGSVTLNSVGAINTANVPGSPYAIVPSLATGGTFNPLNYSITYTNGALTVNPVSLTVTANNAAKTYGQTVTFTGNEFTSVGLQNAETIGSVTLNSAGAINTANVPGSSYTITPSLATGGTFNPANYTITYANGTLTVNPAVLTYNANPTTVNYGQVIPALSGTVTGFVLGQTQATATTGTMIFTSTAVQNSPVGKYPIIGSGLTANQGNYIFVQSPSNSTALIVREVNAALPPINFGNIDNIIASAQQKALTVNVPQPTVSIIIPPASETPSTGVTGVAVRGGAAGREGLTTAQGTTLVPVNVPTPISAISPSFVSLPNFELEAKPKEFLIGNIFRNLAEESKLAFASLSAIHNYNELMLASLITILLLALMRKRIATEMISYKIRSSLNTISGFAKFIYKGKLGKVTPTEKAYLEEILEGTNLIATELAKIEADNIAQINKAISFNLRTALMNIDGYAKLITRFEKELPPAQIRYLDEIKAESHKILNVIPT